MSKFSILVPSILAGNHACLAEGVALISKTGLSWVHIDIMDGYFVPNLSFGPQTVYDLRRHSDLYFDVHLMLENPSSYINPFAKAGANNITIHIRPQCNIADILAQIKDLGCDSGIALNPNISVNTILPYLHQIDLVLIMTVQPGFGGQKFREDMLEKISLCARLRQELGLSFRIEVDGGIDLITGLLCRAHGADTLVSGSAFFKADNYKHFAQEITAPLINNGPIKT